MLEYWFISSFINNTLKPIGQMMTCLDNATLSMNGTDFLKFWVHPSANRITFAGPGDATIAITKKTRAT